MYSHIAYSSVYPSPSLASRCTTHFLHGTPPSSFVFRGCIKSLYENPPLLVRASRYELVWRSTHLFYFIVVSPVNGDSPTCMPSGREKKGGEEAIAQAREEFFT